MTEWQDRVLARFCRSDTPLVVALDPDGILLEEQIFQALRADRFDLLTYTDPITFRHAYEPGYRAPQDNSEETPRLIVRFTDTRRESVPYDLLQRGECIRITLADLFPGLDYRTVQALGSRHYNALYEAAQTLRGDIAACRRQASIVIRLQFRPFARSEIRSANSAMNSVPRIVRSTITERISDSSRRRRARLSFSRASKARLTAGLPMRNASERPRTVCGPALQ